MVPRKSGGIAIALQNGFHSVDTATGVLSFIADPELDKPDNRVNDGSCDRMGRFWAGTQHVTIREPHGSLYRLDPDHSVRKMFEGITVTNMVRFSPDDRTLYYADTYSDRMYAFDYSLADGAIANRRVFVDTSSHPGHPDGSAIDADGCLWNAEYGSRVVRYTPQGRIDRTIAFPVTQPTSCCFGGPNLDTLYVTSAMQRIEPEKLRAAGRRTFRRASRCEGIAGAGIRRLAPTPPLARSERPSRWCPTPASAPLPSTPAELSAPSTSHR